LSRGGSQSQIVARRSAWAALNLGLPVVLAVVTELLVAKAGEAQKICLRIFDSSSQRVSP